MSAPAPASSPPIALLRHATVYDPAPRGVQDVLLAGGRIAAIGAALSAPPLDWEAAVIDLAGMTLIPGLIDAHVHLCGGGGEAGPETKVAPLQRRQLLEAGVTSVVGVLGTDGTTRSPRELLAATRAMRRLGLSAWMWTGAYPVPTPTITGCVRDDIVLIEQVIGAGEVAISDHRSAQPTFDDIAKLAAECHVGGLLAGKAGVLHLHLGDGARGLDFVRRILDETELPPRSVQPTHCNRNPRLWAEAMALAPRGVPIDITAFPADDDDPALPAATAAAAWLDAGLPPRGLTISSDGGGCIPVWDGDGQMLRMDVGTSATLLAALRAFVAAGRPLEAILPAMTSNVAAALRLPGKGRIAVGGDADLVVLDAGGALRHVVAGGRWLLSDGVAALAPLEVR